MSGPAEAAPGRHPSRGGRLWTGEPGRGAGRSARLPSCPYPPVAPRRAVRPGVPRLGRGGRRNADGDRAARFDLAPAVPRRLRLPGRVGGPPGAPPGRCGAAAARRRGARPEGGGALERRPGRSARRRGRLCPGPALADRMPESSPSQLPRPGNGSSECQPPGLVETGFSRSGGRRGGLQGRVGGFVLGRWDMADLAVQPEVVEPVDVLDVVDAAPGASVGGSVRP